MARDWTVRAPTPGVRRSSGKSAGPRSRRDRNEFSNALKRGLYEAIFRRRDIREAGGNPFYDYQIPQAALALKQGFGRLIRSKSDRGVLVMLDNRITKQRYGQVFFDSLPDYGFTTELLDVERFFDV